VVDFIELSFLAVNDERLQQKVDGRELIVESWRKKLKN